MESKIKIRQSQEADIAAISAVLVELSEAGMRSLPSDPDFVRDRYVLDPNRVSSAVAELDQEIVGLQILSRASADNPYGVPVGWASSALMSARAPNAWASADDCLR